MPVRWKLAEIVKRAKILKYVLALPDQNVVCTVRAHIERPNLYALCDSVADLLFRVASISH
jgi:hypothetical protein